MGSSHCDRLELLIPGAVSTVNSGSTGVSLSYVKLIIICMDLLFLNVMTRSSELKFMGSEQGSIKCLYVSCPIIARKNKFVLICSHSDFVQDCCKGDEWASLLFPRSV